MGLPLKLPLDQMQTKWKSSLDPVLANPLLAGQAITAKLVAGNNVINHGLSSKLQGWFLTRIDSASTVYDSQSINPTPQLTLVLVASAPCNVTLWVF